MRRDGDGPYSLDRLAALPPPALFTTEPGTWVPRLVQWFEEASGRKLYPMQVEMLLIEALAYAMSVLGQEAQLTVEQHLVTFADASGLERLGPNRSTPRLPPSKARTTIRFSVPVAQTSAVQIPVGTRLGAGPDVFSTLAPAVIALGRLNAEVPAEALVAGESGNGYLPGQISTMLDPVAGVVAANTTESEGGADQEILDLYRLRVANAFERISTGGSFEWYRETAISVSSAIIDVAIVRPQPCVIDIYPLTLAGATGPVLRNQVRAAFDTSQALDIRFGDDVFVKPPIAVTGAPVLTLRGRGMASTIEADATAAAQGVLQMWREQLGPIIAPSEIEKSVKSLTGVIDAEVSGLAFQALGRAEFFVASLTVNIVVIP